MRISIGDVEGREWEAYCQKLLKIRYKNDGYQEVPARYGGDLGIEGFTQEGLTFQCYCPEGQPTSKELYEGQRDKITTDIGKLIKNGAKLAKLIGNTKVTGWHFLTPLYENKDLRVHCTRKEQEVLRVNGSHIDIAFTILIQTEDDFIEERGKLIGAGQFQVCPSVDDVTDQDIVDWEQNNQHIATIRRKIDKLAMDDGRKTRLIRKIVRGYIYGQNLLNKIRKDFPEHYAEILKVKSAEESDVEQRCILNKGTPGDLLYLAQEDYETRLKEHLRGALDSPSIHRLAQEAMSDWIIGCSVDF
ncbi:hypothetical protein KKA14_05470 [bacterium]|nr:hypothetical protein [bacterium]